MPAERVQKILAQAGITSRRKAEELITEGAVTINGETAKLGDKAEWGKDAIKVNGKLLTRPEEPIYLAFHKPRAVISMMEDPEGRPTLADYLTKVKSRIFPVGRLDFNSEGLILLTNDGGFGEIIQRRDDIPRVYEVKIKGHPNEEMLDRIRRGAKVGGRFVKPHSVALAETLTQKVKVEVVLMGAGALDLKALFEERGFLVERVVRVAIGHLSLLGIAPGEFKVLKASQVEALLQQPELGLRWIEERAAKRKPVRAADPSGEDSGERRPRGRGAPIRRSSEDRPRGPRTGGFGRGGEDRPRAPRFGGGGEDRPRGPRTGGFGRGGEDRPRAPRFGGGGEDRPRGPRTGGFGRGGEDRPRSPRFGGGGEDRPRGPRTGGFGRGGEDRPRGPRSGGFGRGGDDRPRSGGRGAPRPSRDGGRRGPRR